MSARWREPEPHGDQAATDLALLPMATLQLDAVLAIEAAAYAFPWTRGNFIDSIAAGYIARLLVDAQAQALGYFVAMQGVDEMHLLNITVAPHAQGRGHARHMLQALAALCREFAAKSLWLEVRASNQRARAIYARLGFAEVSLRKGYYPAALGRREDAVVMSLPISESSVVMLNGLNEMPLIGAVMSWDERQIAMLREIGVRVWAAPTAAHDVRESAALDDVDDVGHAQLAAENLARIGSSGISTSSVNTVNINAMDWPMLRETVATCTACRLCESRRQTVFGVGNTNAHWMIVGEAPGEQEDRQGEPFVGKSGQLLDNMLRAIGLTRGEASAATQVYIANTIKCRPPGNRNPEPDELAKCEGYLIRQIQLVKPKIILAMGRFAVQSLLRSSEPIGRLRGRVHHYQGVPLIVTYHPAYLLRNLEDKAKAWEDLCLAVETAQALTHANELTSA